MDLSTITVSDFKGLFPRDFPYLPVWDNTKTYNTDDIVYLESNTTFYKCLNDAITSNPSTTPLDWEVYSDKIFNYILDSDIEKAFLEAQITLNQGLFSSDNNITIGYIYLTAHYLCNDINGARDGINSSGAKTTASKSVGSVSESYAIPEAWTSNPILNYYTTTSYGLKYLNLVLPCLIGNVGVVGGETLP